MADSQRGGEPREQSPDRHSDDDAKPTVRERCGLFEAARSGYYAHLRKAERQHRQEDQHLGQQIEAAFKANRKTYGSPRLVDELHKKGLRCGKTRCRRLMQERGLVGPRVTAPRLCVSAVQFRR